jgi:hypothetical protein
MCRHAVGVGRLALQTGQFTIVIESLADAGEGRLITCIGGGRGEARQNFTDIPFGQ